LNFPTNILNDFVHSYSLASFNNEIYVGGNMYFEFEGQFIHDIIKYDGTNWHKVANGTLEGTVGDVQRIIVYKDELYIGGLIYPTGGNPGAGILKLEGDQWVDVGGSILATNPTVHDMFIHDDKLYVVGSFHYVGEGIYADGIAAWDGERWCSPGGEFDNRLTTGESFNGELYIGGAFLTIDGEPINRFAKWTGGDYVDTCGAIVSTLETEVRFSNIELFPNPTSDVLHLSTTGDFQNKTFTLSIYSILGAQLFVQDDFSFSEEIDVSRLLSGTYILRLQSDEGILARKFVVQR
jgi:hypothetical protein